MGKKGRGRRTVAQRLALKNNRSTVGYIRKVQAEMLEQWRADLESGKLQEEFYAEQDQNDTGKQ